MKKQIGPTLTAPRCSSMASLLLGLGASSCVIVVAPDQHKQVHHVKQAEAVAETWSPHIEANLVAAGANRSELERALQHYKNGDDPQKYVAIQFLIENMEGQGYSIIELVTGEGEAVSYNSLDHANFDEASGVLDQLEATHGSVDFKGTQFVNDLEVITADFLIESVDLAFEAWRTNPWSQGLTFEAFLEHVLPYRGSNEPLESWRPLVIDRLADAQAELGAESDARTAAVRINREATRWLGFDTIFYLHPTDMGYAEMVQRGKGRCEDITNMQTYAARASALASAADYTPYWADRDNNHAWNVMLDENGEGNAGLSHRAAKVYRKTFSIQRECLSFDLAEGEDAPRWLDRKHYIDVTSQYKDVAHVEAHLTVTPPASSTHAYLAVFNAGEWNAIDWARLEQQEVHIHDFEVEVSAAEVSEIDVPVCEATATFENIGLDIGYLPAYFADGELIAADAPFFLDLEGNVHPYAGTADAVDALLSATSRNKPEYDEAGSLKSRLQEGDVFELFQWSNEGWQSLGKETAGSAPITRKLPADGLYWLVKQDSKRLERPFMLENGMQKWM